MSSLAKTKMSRAKKSWNNCYFLPVPMICNLDSIKELRKKSRSKLFSNAFMCFFCSHLHCERLKDLVADHLDHLHYINDILCLNILELNEILTEYLLDRLIIPLYLYSLVTDENAPLVCILLFNFEVFCTIFTLTK